MAEGGVRLVGIKALLKDVDKLTHDERSPLFAAMKRAGYNAVKPVATATREKIPDSTRKDSATHKHGALAGSVRPSAYRSGAAVRMGSKKAPFAGWMEFGGTRLRPNKSSRPFFANGRYLFFAARQLSQTAGTQYADEINQLFGRTAIWTNSSSTPGSVHD